ncbi:MAG TPA: lysozyme inhibitor LprI family protein [Acidimicrobiia bacterium]|nr:lysozyme inhibitor LprI family protein [Acidimicrobiia bacterium]
MFVRTILAAVAVLTTTASCASSDGADAASVRSSDVCSRADTLSIVECLEGELDRADADMQAAYREARAAAQESVAWFEREPGHDDWPVMARENAAGLEASHETWLAYREEFCGSMGPVGGTAAGPNALTCKVELALDHTKALCTWVAPNVDTTEPGGVCDRFLEGAWRPRRR